MFFREMKEPIIPWKLVENLFLAANNKFEEEKINQIKHHLKTLPTSNQATLAFLMRHLKEVNEFKEQNNMEIRNLAIGEFYPQEGACEIPVPK